ncbi:MAG: LOG family protein [Candidatus Woesearchaeota archaeon]|nr:LOG family protein [Candidatus Woesearchaeota archaeon]
MTSIGLNDSLARKIKERYGQPIIGVIGATMPSIDYDPEKGFEAGYILRDILNSINGALFTGGVEGVGIDAYAGIVAYCQENKSPINMPDDNFFVLVPEFEFFQGRKGMNPFPYQLPQGYRALGMLTSKHHVTIETAGYDMAERRKYLSEIGDVFVVLNGGYGTLDEATMALMKQKPVVSLYNTGGAARILYDVKNDTLNPDQKMNLLKSQVNVTELLNINNRDNIHLVPNSTDLYPFFKKLF